MGWMGRAASLPQEQLGLNGAGNILNARYVHSFASGSIAIATGTCWLEYISPYVLGIY